MSVEYRIVTHDGKVPGTDRYSNPVTAQRYADDVRDVYGRLIPAHVEQRDVGDWQPLTTRVGDRDIIPR